MVNTGELEIVGKATLGNPRREVNIFRIVKLADPHPTAKPYADTFRHRGAREAPADSGVWGLLLYGAH